MFKMLEELSYFRNGLDSVEPVSAGRGGGGDKNAPRLASRLKILHAVAATAGKSRHYFASMLREQVFK
jgi:hypothetical protein